MGTQVTRKGQVTIPKKVRDYLGITPGTAVEFDLRQDGEVVVHKTAGHKTGGERRRKPGRFARLKGLASGGMSTDEIMALTRGE
jgi:AbrB family looped-hinge helix DNA binding protein